MASLARPAQTSVAPTWWVQRSSAGQDLLLAAALHERPLPVAWATAWQVEDAEIDACIGSGILAETPEGFALADADAAAGILEAATWSHRKRIRLKLAEACLQPPVRAEEAAEHLEKAGDMAGAARAYLAAADAHCRQHRHAAACRCFFAGLGILPRDTPDDEVVRALQSLGRCAALAADVSDGTRRLRNWASTPPWIDRIHVRVEAHLQLAALLERDGRHVEGAQARRAAARDLAALGRDEEAARASIAAAPTLAYAGQIQLGREAADAAVHAAQRAKSPSLEAQAFTWRGVIFGMLGDLPAGQADLTHALQLALSNHLTTEAAEAQRLLGSAFGYVSHYEDEQDAYARVLNFCRKHDQTYSSGICLGCLSYSYLRSGNWKRSEQTARRVVADREVPVSSRYVAKTVLGLLHAHRGEPRTAVRMLESSMDWCRGAGFLVMDLFNLPGLALVAESTGKSDEAARRYVEMLEFWRSTDDRHNAIPGLLLAANFFAENDRADDTAGAAEALDRIASLTGNPEAAGAACAAAGELFLIQDDPGKAAGCFRNALAHFERVPLSVEPMLARLRLGVALLKRGDSRDADACFAEARQQARRLGARPWLAKVDGVMATATSLTPAPAPGASAWDLLSARQRDVARELAQGRTNKEIAQKLGLSVRTVDMHVAHILARLDCRTRTEAASRVMAALA